MKRAHLRIQCPKCGIENDYLVPSQVKDEWARRFPKHSPQTAYPQVCTGCKQSHTKSEAVKLLWRRPGKTG